MPVADRVPDARYHAIPPKMSASATRSATESKNAPRFEADPGRFRHYAVERVHEAADREQHDANAEVARGR